MRGVKIAVLGAAAVAGVGVVALVQSELDAVRRAAQSAPTPAVQTPAVAMTEVLVAAASLERGQKTQTSSFEWRPWPKDSVVDAFATRENMPDAVATYAGSLVRVPLVAGEPIIAAKLIQLDGSGMMSALLREGMRAVAVKVTPETGAGGFILPGDFVDVILTRSEKVETPSRSGGVKERDVLFTDTMILSVRVLAIDETYEEDSETNNISPKRTATLEVTAEMAEILALAEQAGRVTLSLRAFADSSTLAGEPPIPEVAIDLERLKSVQIGSLSRTNRYGKEYQADSEDAEDATGDVPRPSRGVIVVRGSVRTNMPLD